MTTELLKTSFNETFDAIVHLKRRYKGVREGYRDTLYRSMTTAMGFVIDLRRNPKFEEEFRKRIACGDEDITYSVVSFVISAVSADDRKRAWKYARVLDHLTETKNVPLSELLDELSQTGVENLAREAAEATPRLRRTGIKSRVESKKREKLEKSPEPDHLPADIRISTSFSKKFDKIAVGDKFKIVATRFENRSDKLVFEVKKIIKIKSSADDKDSWND